MEDNTFQIAEPSVSSHHCELTLRGTELAVKDLNSTNGTFINGQRISEGVLKPGQTMRLGSVELRLEDGTPLPPSKKQQDHTQLLPGGVKLTDLEQGGRPVGSPFAKKSAGVNKLFLYVGIGLAIFIIALLVFVVLQF